VTPAANPLPGRLRRGDEVAFRELYRLHTSGSARDRGHSGKVALAEFADPDGNILRFAGPPPKQASPVP
jgi:hypothetical protein